MANTKNTFSRNESLFRERKILFTEGVSRRTRSDLSRCCGKNEFVRERIRRITNLGTVFVVLDSYFYYLYSGFLHGLPVRRLTFWLRHFVRNFFVSQGTIYRSGIYEMLASCGFFSACYFHGVVQILLA